MVRANSVKKRYIHFKLSGDFKEIEATHILYELIRIIGEFGYSKALPKITEFEGGKGIMRCNRDSVQEVLAALALINSLNGKEARVVANRISGTIKSLKKKANEQTD